MTVKAAPPTVTHDTPIGTLTLAASDTGLTRCTFRSVRPLDEARDRTSPAARQWLDRARRELDGYFAGDLRAFTVSVDLHRVSGLYRRVLHALDQVGVDPLADTAVFPLV